jgi:magnesium chelatase subunit I
MAITRQEAWTERDGHTPNPVRRPGDLATVVPDYVREVVEEIAFQARNEQKIDRRSGVSQRLPITCLENVVSNAERRAITNDEPLAAPRVTDVYVSLPSITGKFELEYEGELRGAENVARDLIRAAVANVFNGYFDGTDVRQVIEWFDLGGSLQLSDVSSAAEVVDRAGEVQGLIELARHAGLDSDAPAPLLASAVDFVLEGLYAQRKITRSEEWRYQAAEQPRRQPRSADVPQTMPMPGTKKKYYN